MNCGARTTLLRCNVKEVLPHAPATTLAENLLSIEIHADFIQ